MVKLLNTDHFDPLDCYSGWNSVAYQMLEAYDMLTDLQESYRENKDYAKADEVREIKDVLEKGIRCKRLKWRDDSKDSISDEFKQFFEWVKEEFSPFYEIKLNYEKGRIEQNPGKGEIFSWYITQESFNKDPDDVMKLLELKLLEAKNGKSE